MLNDRYYYAVERYNFTYTTYKTATVWILWRFYEPFTN